MTRSELITAIAKKFPSLTPADVNVTVKALLDEMARNLEQGNRIEIRGFGSFCLTERPARMGRNPKTGKIVPVPKKRAVRFKMGKEMLLRLRPSKLTAG